MTSKSRCCTSGFFVSVSLSHTHSFLLNTSRRVPGCSGVRITRPHMLKIRGCKVKGGRGSSAGDSLRCGPIVVAFAL